MVLKMAGYKDIERAGHDIKNQVSEILKALLKCKGQRIIYKKTSFEVISGDCLKLEDGTILRGKKPVEKFKDAEELVIALITAGREVQRYIDELSARDIFKGYLADAAASYLVEILSEKFWREMTESYRERGLKTTGIISPGSVNFAIDQQRKIFKFLNPDVIGVKLSPSYLMEPIKSLSVIFGAGKKIKQVKRSHNCSECGMKDCFLKELHLNEYSFDVVVRQNGEKTAFEAQKGNNLLKLLHDNDILISSPCAGQGICGKCRVKFITQPPPVSSRDIELLSSRELKQNYRLACQVEIDRDMEIELTDIQEMEIMTGGLNRNFELDPVVRKKVIELERPSLEDQRDYLKRICDGINSETISLNALRNLDRVEKNKMITVTFRDNTIVRVESGDKSKELYGIAVDIGTTTVVMYLWNLSTGEELKVYSFSNPQKKFGADVISRIKYSEENPNGLKELQKELVKGLNSGIEKLIKDCNFNKDDILHLTLAGNTVMLHTLCGISASSISVSPYIPLFTNRLKLNPVELGINTMSKEGEVELLPSVSGYVGADIMADIISTGLYNTRSWNLLIDVGTNGEIVLGNGFKFYACSAAAGPAFEGASITCGMAGVPGAISSFKFENRKVKYATIGNIPPRGICGSGLFDIIASLYKEGVLTETGAFADENNLNEVHLKRIFSYKGQKAYRLVKDDPEIILTQKDVREIQLAKGAIAAGIKVLLDEAGIDFEKLEKVYLAGGFGNYLNPESACLINMIPPELKGKIIRAGNGAGIGAKMVLLDRKLTPVLEEIKEKVEYIELSSSQKFQAEFINMMGFAVPN